MSRTILVATDGTSASLGALRVADAMATQQGCRVITMGVVEPVPVFDAGFMVALPEMELFQARQDALRHEIEERIHEVGADSLAREIVVNSGVPAHSIVQEAEAVAAEAIVMGLGRHRPMDRVFGTETALQVIRISHVPVMAVPESTVALPSSAALGVDFSVFSQRAAKAALSFLKAPWDAHLVHVLSGIEFLPTMSEEWLLDYQDELRQRLQDLGESLPAEGKSSYHVHVLEGEPAHQLLAFVEDRSVEMLVAGSHGLSFVGRLLMGSVSTRLIRGASVPVFVVPPVERWEEVRTATEEVEVHRWVQQLREFTRANAGRRSTLELHDPELGAQECGRNFPFWGIDYDSKRDRVDIMLGRSGTVEGHLTHSIPAPQDIQIGPDEDGNPVSVHLRLRRGQVILKIHRK